MAASPTSTERFASSGASAGFRTACLLAWVVATGVLLINEGPLIARGPILSRDDQALLSPLRNVHVLGEYVQLLRSHRVLDLQPVRDLSFWIDLQVSARVGHPIFHLTNLLLLLILLALVQRLWISRLGRHRASCVALVLFAAHPAVANTVSWISARKHLLSAVFILAATLLLERPRPGRARGVLAGLLFLASVFSQPITVLWPVWLAFDRSLREGLRAGLLRALPYLLLAIPVMAINVAYYRGAYAVGGHAKFIPLSTESATVSLLAVGRYVFNALAPISIATEYDPGRLFNLIGLLLLPVAVAFSIKWLGPGRALPAWGFVVFPLAVVTLRMTNIFVSDTYLLVPLVGVGWLVAALLERLEAHGALLAGVGVLLTIPLALGSHAVAASWGSDEALWDHAYRTEPTPAALAKESFYLANAHKFAEARELATRLLAWRPDHSEAAQVYSRAVYFDPSLTPAEKYRAIAACPVQDAWTRYLRASLDAGAHDFRRAYQELLPVADDAQRLGTDVAKVAAEAQFFCVKAGGAGCEELPGRFRRSAPEGWRTGDYLKRAGQLGIAPVQ